MATEPNRSQFTDYEITETMIRFGGGFVSGLGRLFRQADAENRRRLRAAFPEYWAEYDELTLKVAQRDGFARTTDEPR